MGRQRQSSSSCSSWADPRARLLDGAQWEAVQADVLPGLSLEEPVAEHLAGRVRALDAAWQLIAERLPRLLRLPDGSTRTTVRCSWPNAAPPPARRPAAGDICPHTGRARLGYDRARVLLEKYAGLDLHQLRHSAATHLGDAEVPLQLIMGKTRHKNPRTAMRYVKPGPEAIAKVTEILAPHRRTH